MGPVADEQQEDDAEFDFGARERAATETYQRVRTFYEECALAVYAVLTTALEGEGILVHSIESRAKSLESYGRKAATPDPEDPARPKYSDPLTEITDLSAVRVITFLLAGVEQVSQVIEREFEIVETINRSARLQGEKLGYQSVHYLVRFSDLRTVLPEYARFASVTTEIQVRTIVQHAWAEIEHDIQYKAVEAIPVSIRRRFTALAGLLEIADREFQAISDEDRRVRSDARVLIERGDLDRVEITPDALKVYLDRKFGPDGRMSEYSYEWTTKLLKQLGFGSMRQVEDCIARYDDSEVSKVIWGSRQGQLTRLEGVLLAGMGDAYAERHTWRGHEWFAEISAARLAQLRARGVEVGEYRPSYPKDAQSAA